MPPQPPKRNTRTGVIAKLAQWHGGHNASDNAWGRLGSQVDPYDDAAVADYFYKAITADAQKPLLEELTKLKAQLFDLQNGRAAPEPVGPVERLMIAGLGKEAAEVAIGMIHDAINQGRGMGMDEGWADCENGEKHPWRKELEVFAGYVDPDERPKKSEDDIPLGSRVLLRRGGHVDPPNCVFPSMGHYRDVKATYLSCSGPHNVQCRLEQDDPYADLGYCTKKGDEGNWSRSIMRLDPEHAA